MKKQEERKEGQEQVQQQQPTQLVIDINLAQEVHSYISKTPTGDVPFDRVFKMLAGLERLAPVKQEFTTHLQE